MEGKHEPGTPQFCDYGNCQLTAKYEVKAILNSDTCAHFCTKHKDVCVSVIESFSGDLAAFLMVSEIE